jgi:peroxiredoxin (alkyl hydroperoxide reductase subunit C)
MELRSQRGTIKLPESVAGRWLVLLPFPSIFGPVCTSELVSFARSYQTIKELGAEVLGIAVASHVAVMKWLEWVKTRFGVDVGFPVAADPDAEASRKLGLLGSSPTRPRRVLVIADPEATVRLAYYYPEELGRSAYEAVRAIVALRIAREKNLHVPADWPSSQLVGDSMLLPPAQDEREARERVASYRCFDWWMCFTDHGEKAAVDRLKDSLRTLLSEGAR